MIIPQGAWDEYIASLSKVNSEATERVRKYIESHEIENRDDLSRLVDYAYGIATYYGEAAAELAAEMYDVLAEISGAEVDPAEPAATATYQDAAAAVFGTLKQAAAAILVPGAVGRLVKLAAQDTTIRNAQRDGILIAWIPRGDTCPYCIMVAGEGWKPASRATAEDGHARHIHANCDCAFGVKFNENTKYAGYNPDRYRAQYERAEGDTQEEKLNSMRRRYYAQNKERINEQKRNAYARSKALEAPSAEETDAT